MDAARKVSNKWELFPHLIINNGGKLPIMEDYFGMGNLTYSMDQK